MRLSQGLIWALLALAADAKCRQRAKTCPIHSTRTSTVLVTVTRGSVLPTETSFVSLISTISQSAEASADLSSQAVSSLAATSAVLSVESSSVASSALASVPYSSASLDVPAELSSQAASASTSIIQSSSVDSSSEVVSSPARAPSSAPPTTSAIQSSSVASSSAGVPSSAASPTTSALVSSSVATSSTSAPVATNFARAYPADSVDNLRDESMSKLEEYLGKRPANNGCTLENAAIRREWSDLSLEEREDYIQSVQCLQTKPARTPSSVAGGAKSRFDDFVVAHIQQTPTVHNTANFLSWHRYFMWAYETALRDECGYKGFHPYWNWDRYAADPENSPLFNGNATSISGNSARGGCVTTGPFKDMTVNLGPGTSLHHNPRCLKRDISRSNAAGTTADKTLPLITNSRDILTFQDRLQLPNGVHASGHFTIGGDPGGDIYASNGDPAFYLHHAMVDRVWWIWQLQDLETRLGAVAGSNGPFGRGGGLGSLLDDVNLGLVGGGVSLGSLLDTMGGMGGEFCYIYM